MAIAEPVPTPPATLGHVPALDGIRAVAVIGVLLFHSGFSWASGGFLGVDAFFVLSGFLITALLLAEHTRTGTIRFTDFWVRRARRLLPAVVLMLAAIAAYAALLAAPDELLQIRDDGTATVLYLANWHFIQSGRSYFEGFATPSPFRHCWSLAIEEQFYLVWPALVLLLLRLDKQRRALGASIVLLAAASVVAMAALFDASDVSRAYYGTDTRAVALLVGALLATHWSARPVVEGRYARAGLHAAAATSVGILGWLWCTATGSAPWLYRGGFLGHAVLVAIVIAGAMQPRAGVIGAALSWAPLTALGRISYGVYLWHWPVFVALSPTRFDLPMWLSFTLRTALTLALAVASYVLVERPMRDRARTRWRSAIALAAAAAASLEGLYILALAAPQRIETTTPERVAKTVPGPPWASESGPAAGAIRVMLVGDSVASSLAGGLERASVQHGFVFWNATLPGCGLASDYGERWTGTWEAPDPRCVPGWRERWKQQIEAGSPDVVVLLTGAQDTYDRRLGDTVYRFDEDTGAQLATRDLEEAIAVLSARGAAVVLLTAPHYRLGWPQTLEIDRSYLNPSWIDRHNRIVTDVARASGGTASTIDLNAILQPDGTWTDEIAGVRVRTKDRVHLTPAGADMAAAKIVEAVVESGRTARTRSH